MTKKKKKNEDMLGAYALSAAIIGVLWAFISGLFLFAGVTSGYVHTATTGACLLALYLTEKLKKEK